MQLLIFNEEFLVSACHQRALITSLPFVHTARRSYRLNDPVRPPDCGNAAGSPAAMPREAVQTLSFRGRRSRNKVSVGEPAEGSLPRTQSRKVAPATARRRGSNNPRAARRCSGSWLRPNPTQPCESTDSVAAWCERPIWTCRKARLAPLSWPRKGARRGERERDVTVSLAPTNQNPKYPNPSC